MKKQTKITIILCILVIAAVSYIAYDKYTGYSIKQAQEEQNALLQQGTAIGYRQAVLQLYQEAIKCNQVPIHVENQTINIIAVECLQAIAQQQGTQ